MPKSKLTNDPLKFSFNPDEALRAAMLVKRPKHWGKAIRKIRKSR